jgi:hypothetical protein
MEIWIVRDARLTVLFWTFRPKFGKDLLNNRDLQAVQSFSFTHANMVLGGGYIRWVRAC